ncbi:ABC transporter ATP-binding protein [Desulfovibrio sp. OttesenSCG-928-A18]|nr:ABC transporter ATP-binding protein [Desulfovibrio sp. OttesenSCG-928-A18]
MISLRGVSKTYNTKRGKRVILDDISRDFPPGVNVGILGRNGAGKSTLLRIIGGGESPDTGKVLRSSRISWPIGFAGGFNMKLSGRQNLRFICRLYEIEYKDIVDFVADFSELGEYMDMPVYTYSSGMRAKLTFGLSMAFNFDYYLIDEVTAVGDAVFKKKSEAFFDARRKNATLLVVSHSMLTIRRFCDLFLVLHKGRLLEFSSNKEAEQFYNEVCCGQKK